MNKIAVIGNSCAGKTRLSRRLAEAYKLPLTHVDQIQYTEGLKFRPFKESIEILSAIQNQPQWIIDGYGPLDILEKRLQSADWIIMIDLPLTIHYFWAIKRVINNLFFSQRKELPANSSERNVAHIIKLFKTIYQVHTKMRPEMLRILARVENKSKTTLIKNLKDWNLVYQKSRPTSF